MFSMEITTESGKFSSRNRGKMEQFKKELVVELKRINKENQQMISMIKLMSSNCNSLQAQLAKQQQEDNERPSPKNMGKILKLGIDVPQQAVGDYSVDSGSTVSESSEEKSYNKYSMDDGQLRLPSKKRKINYVMEQRDNSSMDSDLPSKKARVANKGSGYPSVPLPKKIVTVRRGSEETMVSDGCQWRKYGQKTTIKNKWPRAYFKCAVPSCPVKKQVQRCDKDPTLVTTTYKGEHNHLLSQVAAAAMNDASDEFKPSTTTSILTAGNQLSFPASVATISSMGSCPTITLDFTDNANTTPNRVLRSIHPQLPAGRFLQQSSPLYNTNMLGLLSRPVSYRKLGVDPVASTKVDPHFTGALAAVIADSMLKLGVRPCKGSTQNFGV